MSTPWLLAIPCDMPWMDGSEVRPLLGARRAGLDALYFRRGGRPEPMPLLIHRRALPSLKDSLDAQCNKVMAVLEALTTLPVEHHSHQPRDVFQNLNTPEDYRRALDDFVT